MFWNKKKSNLLPDLPPLKTGFADALPNNADMEAKNNEKYEKERHALPSFPDSPMKQGFSQSAIKDAIDTGELPEMPDYGNESEPSIPEPGLPKMQELRENEETLPAFPASSNARKNSELFIKVERFHSARRALASAQQKIKELDASLKRIRETKLREEQELAAWEKEVSLVKEKLEAAASTLFEKLP